jgi:hypothetical protein
MLGRVALIRTCVSEEHVASIIKVTRIGELGTTLAVTSNRITIRNFPEDGILHIHRCENLKSYNCLFADGLAAAFPSQPHGHVLTLTPSSFLTRVGSAVVFLHGTGWQ